jgi:uncharacterized protein YjiS (DUF1127 family)
MRSLQRRHAKASLLTRSRHAYLTPVEFVREMVCKMKLIRNYRNWRRYNETVRELNRLSDRQLNDLGILRGEIEVIAAKVR